MAKKSQIQRKGGKKCRKYGRSKAKCEKYRAAGTRERNKLRKLKKHCKRHPGDLTAAEKVVKMGVW